MKSTTLLYACLEKTQKCPYFWALTREETSILVNHVVSYMYMYAYTGTCTCIYIQYIHVYTYIGISLEGHYYSVHYWGGKCTCMVCLHLTFMRRGGSTLSSKYIHMYVYTCTVQIRCKVYIRQNLCVCFLVWRRLSPCINRFNYICI